MLKNLLQTVLERNKTFHGAEPSFCSSYTDFIESHNIGFLVLKYVIIFNENRLDSFQAIES